MIGAAVFILGQTPALWGCDSVIRCALAGGCSGLLLGLLTAACSTPDRPLPSWKVFPLSRRMPHDGLAVVSQPDGYGLHLFLETDTSAADLCTPRWFPDAARLFNGNGTAPFSAGLVPRLSTEACLLLPGVVNPRLWPSYTHLFSTRFKAPPPPVCQGFELQGQGLRVRPQVVEDVVPPWVQGRVRPGGGDAVAWVARAGEACR